MSKWKPGMPSPNPKGRPKGIVDKRARIAKELMDQGSEIARVVIEAAKAGDMQAANIVLSRLQPPLRARAERVQFELDPDAPLTQQAEQVLKAVANGEVDPDTGRLLIESISSFARLREVDELGERLRAVENRLSDERSLASRAAELRQREQRLREKEAEHG